MRNAREWQRRREVEARRNLAGTVALFVVVVCVLAAVNWIGG